MSVPMGDGTNVIINQIAMGVDVGLWDMNLWNVIEMLVVTLAMGFVLGYKCAIKGQKAIPVETKGASNDGPAEENSNMRRVPRRWKRLTGQLIHICLLRRRWWALGQYLRKFSKLKANQHLTYVPDEPKGASNDGPTEPKGPVGFGPGGFGPNAVRCPVCEMWFPNQADWESHHRSELHRRKEVKFLKKERRTIGT